MSTEHRESVPVLIFPRQTLVSLLVFALVWEVLSHLAPALGIPPFAIPSLLRIAKAITTITPLDVAVTLARVIAALIVSFVLGIMINAETQLLYSSDYPHWDFDLPSTIYDLPFLTEQAKRNILGGNAMKVFNLKLPAQKLARVA